MNARAARQIREGIIIAQQTLRHERVGPRRFKSALAATANTTYRWSHQWDDRLKAITRIAQ